MNEFLFFMNVHVYINEKRIFKSIKISVVTWPKNVKFTRYTSLQNLGTEAYNYCTKTILA